MTSIKPTPERRASDVLYDDIAASRNSIRRENIRLIKLACDQMEKDKIAISAAEVSRRCGENGPAYSTISNAGSKLGDYVRLRITEQAAMVAPSAGTSRSVADAVADPVLQAQIRDRESTARWLAKENAGLRALFKSLRPGVDIDSLLRGSPSAPTGAQIGAPSRSPLDSQELRGMLLKLMDHLVSARQYRELRGRLTINGKVVLDARELQVLREATGLTDEAWKSRFGDSDSRATHG